LRDPDQVRDDVIDGKITPAFALRHHAVVLGSRGTLDLEATARLRSERATERSGGRHGD
jgi:N-methylhydantoinase B